MLRRSKEYVGDILDSVGNGVGISKARRSSLSKRDSASVGLGGCGAGSRRIADGSRRPTEPLKEEDGELGSSFKKTTPEPPAASPSTSSPEALRPKAEDGAAKDKGYFNKLLGAKKPPRFFSGAAGSPPRVAPNMASVCPSPS